MRERKKKIVPDRTAIHQKFTGFCTHRATIKTLFANFPWPLTRQDRDRSLARNLDSKVFRWKSGLDCTDPLWPDIRFVSVLLESRKSSTVRGQQRSYWISIRIVEWIITIGNNNRWKKYRFVAWNLKLTYIYILINWDTFRMKSFLVLRRTRTEFL